MGCASEWETDDRPINHVIWGRPMQPNLSIVVTILHIGIVFCLTKMVRPDGAFVWEIVSATPFWDCERPRTGSNCWGVI
jgi:hypothetical protein